MAAACVAALLACVALASAASNVKTGRSYVGTIGDGGSTGASTFVGTPIQVSVSADGKTATQTAAVYTPCTSVGPFNGNQVSFPSAKIVNGAFKTTKSENTSTSYATVTIEGRFLSGGRVTGTITGATNISSTGGTGAPCVTTNPWSGKAKRRGFGACNPVSLYDANANYITERHTSCKMVGKTIRKGYRGQGSYSAPPGWKCTAVTIKTGRTSSQRGHLCKRQHTRFQFVIV